MLTTVSPTYAAEIQTPELGYALDGVVRDRSGDLFGVMNGVDYDEWNPETDRLIPVNYSAEDLTGKAACKAELQKAFGLPLRPEVPMFGIVARLVTRRRAAHG